MIVINYRLSEGCSWFAIKGIRILGVLCEKHFSTIRPRCQVGEAFHVFYSVMIGQDQLKTIKMVKTENKT